MPTSGINTAAFKLGSTVHKLLWYRAVPFFGYDLSDEEKTDVETLWQSVSTVGQLSPTASSLAQNQTLVSQLRQLRTSFFEVQESPGFSCSSSETSGDNHEGLTPEPLRDESTSSQRPRQDSSSASDAVPSAPEDTCHNLLVDHFERFHLTVRKEFLYVVTQLAVIDLSDDETRRWGDSFNFGYNVDNVARPIESACDLF